MTYPAPAGPDCVSTGDHAALDLYRRGRYAHASDQVDALTRPDLEPCDCDADHVCARHDAKCCRHCGTTFLPWPYGDRLVDDACQLCADI